MPNPETTGETVADCALSWLETIHMETLRDEPDCGERVRSLVAAAANHVRIRDALVQRKEQLS